MGRCLSLLEVEEKLSSSDDRISIEQGRVYSLWLLLGILLFRFNISFLPSPCRPLDWDRPCCDDVGYVNGKEGFLALSRGKGKGLH